MGAVKLQLYSIYCLYSPRNVLFYNSCPSCFQPMHTNYGSSRTRAPPSLSLSLWLVAQGVPPPDPCAPTPQHSWRINISHTFFQQLLKPFGHACPPQTRTPRCTGLWDPTPWCPQTAPTCSQLALQSPFQFFSLPPDLKIAGNSIFILLSKNFFLSYRAPLPNSRTSRGVPAPSSPAFWVAAEMEKQCRPWSSSS